MDPARIAGLLRPFLDSAMAEAGENPACHSERSEESAPPPSCHSERSEESAFLAASQLHLISTYIDILLRWNARINLTAVRDPEQIVTRHFGESLFAARHLYPNPSASPDLIDLGSGAGFPGLPIKLWVPRLQTTLIESNQKKATFLREVIRALTLTDIDVVSARGEDFSGRAEVVTLRAVERFDSVLPVAARLVSPGGRLALLIGGPQLARARQLLPLVHWRDPVSIPGSDRRLLLVGVLP